MAENEAQSEHPKFESMEKLIRQDGRYPLGAFAFLNEGLSRAVQGVYGDKEPPEPGQRHVTGEQLCLALRDLAIENWGPLARTVLRSWRIYATVDFGHMVYLLVNNGFMQKTESDSLEDFRDVYSFDDAFGRPGTFELKE